MLLVGLVAVLGVPLAYFTGVKLANIENRRLASAPFQVASGEVKPFTDIYVSGGGMQVQVSCGESLEIKVAEHPDEVFFSQPQFDSIYINGQQRLSSEPFQIQITVPMRLQRIDLRNGARMEIPACAVNRTQTTVDLAAAARLAMSGTTADLFLFAATGSKLLPGPQGHLFVEQANIDMVFDSFADLCGADFVVGSAAVSSRVKVRKDILVRGLRQEELDNDCPAIPLRNSV